MNFIQFTLLEHISACVLERMEHAHRMIGLASQPAIFHSISNLDPL